MEAGRDEILDPAGSVGSARGIVVDDLLHADAHMHEVGRHVVEIDEGLVPGEQAQVAVEHRDALLGVVQRVLEQVAAVLDRGGGIVEELEGRLRRNGAAAQQQRQGKARGGGADGRGQQVLGIAQEMDVGLGARLQVLAAAVGEALEGARRALLAEIARHGGAQLADGDAGAEQAEARRDGGGGLAHEDIGLDLLHAPSPGRQREKAM